MAEAVASRAAAPAFRPVPELDAARLDAYLRASLPGLRGTLHIERASGGMSNPTYFIGYDGWSAVLRKQPPIVLSTSAHRIDREYRIISALQGSAIPVPAPIHYCEDADIVGTPFYLMEKLEGRVFSDCALPGLDPADRAACFRSMARTMAAMHNFDWAAAGLSDFGRPGNYFQRQMDGWTRQWAQFAITDNPAIDALIGWLSDHIPSDGQASICHGDYRFANLMFHPTEPRVVGLFDWELATLGHPLADVAFNLQAWFLKPDENGGIAGLDLTALGIPSARDYLDIYYAAATSAERLTRFHIAFAMFRAAVGLSGVALRDEANAGPGAVAREPRRLAIAYARAGIAAIQSWDEDQ